MYAVALRDNERHLTLPGLLNTMAAISKGMAKISFETRRPIGELGPGFEIAAIVLCSLGSQQKTTKQKIKATTKEERQKARSKGRKAIYKGIITKGKTQNMHSEGAMREIVRSGSRFCVVRCCVIAYDSCT